MTLRKLAGVAVLAAALTGCDTIKDKIPSWVPYIGKKEAPPPAPVAAAPAPQPVDTTPKAPPPPAPKPKPVAVADEGWTPVDTGTVDPGMSREQVIALWGVPVAERTQNEWTYLYFRNGCEHSCGTFDMVMLQNGQVVDAVVRADGHGYSGQSSSPRGKLPENSKPAGAAPAGA